MVPTTEVIATSPIQGSKVLSIFLAMFASVALCASMWMNARFGWGLSQDLTDRTILAVLHVLVDPAAALLLIAGSVITRWGRNGEGRAFLFFALLLVLDSMLSVFGFMSARITITQGVRHQHP